MNTKTKNKINPINLSIESIVKTVNETKKIIEREPHRPMEKPTEPNRQIPERMPQRQKEKPNFPEPIVPEQQPHRTLEKPTKLKP